jgi:uncharacterized protein DUF4154
MQSGVTHRARFSLARGVCALLVVACLVPARTGSAEEPEAAVVYSEYQVKAAFLFNFAKFVEWPSSAFPDTTSPITICVIGKDPFEGALADTLRDRTVGGRTLVARRAGPDPEIAGCQVLFVPASEDARLPLVLERVAPLPVLTVGETEHFGQLGGIVRFTLEDNRVRFIVNAASAKRSGLSINAKLLSIAKAVIGRDEPVR